FASFTASKSGVHQLEVSSSGGLSKDGYASLSFLAADSLQEMRGAAVMNQEFMEKIAQVGGGNYYRPEKADLLVRDLNNNTQVHTVTYKLDIWNIPIVFLLLFFCFGLEWLLRRRAGLS
ncbi:MAG: hypothetical protein KJP04_02920, partial [Arenicella sp.]|nr:hypothetical protein [Arenicella sp.]